MIQTKKFQRNEEDFVCEKCGFKVTGNGYTNHCPKCLWSKHVDINPGDRNETCGGLMKPTEVTLKDNIWRITHRCEKCNFTRINKASEADDVNLIIKISAH